MYPFKEGYFAVRNGWYVLAFCSDVKAELISRWILNEPVVVYRKQDGEAVCLSGLCPHRFFPLADSRLSEDIITCSYHGISFDADGICTNIPGQDNIPSSCKLKKYPVAEHGMWLWVWPGDPDKADRSLLPDLEKIGHDGEGIKAEPFYFHEIKARYQLLTDNLTDLSHLAFLHGDSIGSPGNATIPEELTEEPGVLYSRRVMKNNPAPPVLRETQNYHGEVDQISGMDFHYPGLHAGISEMAYPEGHEQAGEVLRGFYVFHAITPATTNTCYYHFSMASAQHDLLEKMKDYLKKVVDEDIEASESIERILSTAGTPAREVIKFSDHNSVRARRMLMKLMDEEAGVQA